MLTIYATMTFDYYFSYQAPTLPPLKYFANLEEVYEMRESKQMDDADWNVNVR